ncbi:MAG: hypothetical protein ABIW79_05120 [Gemmatimonas sp.]
MPIAFPVTLAADGQLARADQADAVAELIGVMAATSEAFWPHAPWFGLLEQFESARADVQEHPRLADAINLALRELGTDDLSVATVRNAPSVFGERRFDLIMTTGSGAPLFRQVKG